jgi:hypothetical protein
MQVDIAGLWYLMSAPFSYRQYSITDRRWKPLLALVFLWKWSSSTYYVLALDGGATAALSHEKPRHISDRDCMSPKDGFDVMEKGNIISPLW